jgi:transcription elongation factor Elf1
MTPIPAAPWWRCIHCGHDKFVEHVFTGHMKGVPQIHCASCEALHSVPDPDSKAALRWQIAQFRDFVEEIAGSCIPDYEEAKRDAQVLLASVDTHAERQDRETGLGPKDG